MSVRSYEQANYRKPADKSVSFRSPASFPQQSAIAADDIVYSRAKRLCDIVAALGLIVLASPALLLIAALIKLDSRGPVLFRQLRNGQHQRAFVVMKFRTMRPSSDGRQAVCGDARVTRVGRFLRASSLDELPQLFNVLRGDMSLVGPRPHPLWLDDKYAGEIDGYRRRYFVKPGITGLAQITGCRGATATRAQMLRRLEKDLEYVENRSLALDMKILALTVPSLVTLRDAY
jgi:putative colanic acid biosynthesis UDP-glucose lipid carrier transferase